jgi:hypothetical protein
LPQVAHEGKSRRGDEWSDTAVVAACQAAYDEHPAEYALLLKPPLDGLVERLAELEVGGH